MANPLYMLTPLQPENLSRLERWAAEQLLASPERRLDLAVGDEVAVPVCLAPTAVPYVQAVVAPRYPANLLEYVGYAAMDVPEGDLVSVREGERSANPDWRRVTVTVKRKTPRRDGGVLALVRFRCKAPGTAQFYMDAAWIQTAGGDKQDARVAATDSIRIDKLPVPTVHLRAVPVAPPRTV